jgi:hypothetical protein
VGRLNGPRLGRVHVMLSPVGDQMYGFVHFNRIALANNPERLTHLIASARQALIEVAAREDRRVHDDTVRLQLLTPKPPPDGLRDELDEAGVEVKLPQEAFAAASPTATLFAIGETSPR